MNLFLTLCVFVGEISTGTPLDREHQSSYQLVVVVQDGGTPPRSATGTAHITVLDENDNAPAFSHTQPGREILIQARNRLAQTLIITLNQYVITFVLALRMVCLLKRSLHIIKMSLGLYILSFKNCLCDFGYIPVLVLFVADWCLKRT